MVDRLLVAEAARRLILRPANPEIKRARQLSAQISNAVKDVLQDRDSGLFVVKRNPTEDDFYLAGWVWPYFKDLKAPFPVLLAKERGGIRLQAEVQDLAVQIAVADHSLIILQKNNLPFIRLTVAWDGDSWTRRVSNLQFGLEFATFLAKSTK